MNDQRQTFLDTQKTESANKAKAIFFCKQIDLNSSKLDDKEWRVLMKVLENSDKYKPGRKRR